MKRALFMQELQNALLMQAALVVLTLVLVSVGLYFSAPPSMVTFPLLILLSSASLAGGSPFFRGFQEKKWPLLLTLPINRSTAWWVMIAAHASSALLTNAAIVVTLLFGPAESMSLAIPLLSGYWVLFAIGSLTILGPPDGAKRISWRYLAFLPIALIGGVLQVLAIGQAAYICFKLGLSPGQPLIGPMIGQGKLIPDWRFWLFCCAVVVTGYLWITRAAFIRAENHLAGVRGRFNLLILAFAVALFLLVPASAELFARFDSWELVEARASNDGKYLAVFDRESNHPSYARLSVIDLHSGATVSSKRQKGVRGIDWSRSGATLNVLLESRAISPVVSLLMPTWDHLMTFSPELLGKGDLSKSEIWTVWPLENEKTLAVISERSQGSIVLWDAERNHEDILASGPLSGIPILHSFHDKMLVDFANGSVSSPVWLIAENVRKLKWNGSEIDLRPRYVIDETVYAAPKSAKEALVHAVPPPLSEAPHGSYLISSTETRMQGTGSYPADRVGQPSLIYINSSTYVFYAAANPDNRTASLFAFDQPAKEWKRFAESFALSDGDQKLVRNLTQLVVLGRLEGIVVDSERGIAAYITGSGDDAHLKVFDSSIGSIVDLGRPSEAGGPGKVDIRRLAGLDGLLVTYGTTAFEYVPGSGKAIPLNLGRPDSELVYLNMSGTEVYRDFASGTVFLKSPNQPERMIWPQ